MLIAVNVNAVIKMYKPTVNGWFGIKLHVKGKVCCTFMRFLKTLCFVLLSQRQVLFGCVLQDLDDSVNGVLSLTVPCPLFLIWMLVGF